MPWKLFKQEYIFRVKTRFDVDAGTLYFLVPFRARDLGLPSAFAAFSFAGSPVGSTGLQTS